MKRFSSISKVAAAAIVGSVLLTGCNVFFDNASASASAVATESTEVEQLPSDGYLSKVISQRSAGKADKIDGNSSNGKYKLEKINGKTIVKKGSKIDTNNNFKEDDNDTLFLNESADLLFHYLILLSAKNFKLSDIVTVLKSRQT